MTSLRYPVGQFEHEGPISDALLHGWIAEIAALPAQMREAVEGLGGLQLNTRYRPEGWTLRQVVHHVPDSHLHAYVRFKWTLTEDEPTIKAYDEAAWARLPDSALPVEPSLAFLDTLHARWVALMETMDEAQWARRFIHPETGGALALRRVAGMYAWHGRHHLAHLTTTIEREGWRT